MQTQTKERARATEAVRRFHDDVRPLCIARLAESFSQSTGLFDRQLRDRQWDDTLDTEDLTSTAICLIGLSRAGIAPETINFEQPRALEALIDVTRRRAYSGGLGLVIWANAVCDGPSLEDLLQRTGCSLDNPTTFVAPITTMETAWLVSGLIHESRRAPGATASAALVAARNELLARYECATKIFRHASNAAPMRHRLRKWVANFADQVYAVQALALLAMTGSDDEAREVAEGCAARLVELQGDLGQWWWHYDPRDGCVAQAYPVYAVHQHAMAPMALMSLVAAGGCDHTDAVTLSHQWISQNETSQDLLDGEHGTVWRNIEPAEGTASRFVRKVRSVAGWKQSHHVMDRTVLEINYETRPYEWAWCLFAGAVADGGEMAGHVV